MTNPKMFGLRKTSLVDYPGLVSAVLFLPGCNLRCPWCQNPEFSSPERETEESNKLLSIDEIFSFLRKRREVLGAVVISGGEPSLYKGLGKLISGVKELGFKVKLDTNGTRPKVLKELHKNDSTRPDYIALDLKIAPDFYEQLKPDQDGLVNFSLAAPDTVSKKKSQLGDALRETCRFLQASGIDHEFRTLALPGDRPNEAELTELAELVDDAPWFFAAFMPGNCLDPAWNDYPSGDSETVKALAAKAIALGKAGKLR